MAHPLHHAESSARKFGGEPCGDPRVAWASEVAAGRTVLGLEDWMAARAKQATEGA